MVLGKAGGKIMIKKVFKYIIAVAFIIFAIVVSFYLIQNSKQNSDIDMISLKANEIMENFEITTTDEYLRMNSLNAFEASRQFSIAEMEEHKKNIKTLETAQEISSKIGNESVAEMYENEKKREQEEYDSAASLLEKATAEEEETIRYFENRR